MDTFWQVIIGTGIGGLLFEIYRLYRFYLKESKENNENQRGAKTSIWLGISGLILPFVSSAAGLIVGFLSMRGKRYKTLSKIGIFVSLLTLLPWLLVLILGE